MVAKAMDFAMGSCNPLLTTGFSPKFRKVRMLTVKCSSISLSSDSAAIVFGEFIQLMKKEKHNLFFGWAKEMNDDVYGAQFTKLMQSLGCFGS